MRPTRADVAVVGAGPAGTAVALLLARAGHEVLLLDRCAFPRAKPCGDCLSPEAARVLDRLGLLAAVEAERPARLEGWRITAPGGESFAGRFEPAAGGDPRVRTAIALARHRLDRVLVDHARRAGALVIEGLRIEDVVRDRTGRVVGVRGHRRSGEPAELAARLVIGADGLRSIVARRLGLVRRAPRLRKLSLTAHVRGVHGLGTLGELHLADGLCAGLAPVEDSRAGPESSAARPNARRQPPAGPPPVCNLTLVVDADRFAAAVAGDPETFFWHALRRFPRLAGRLDDAAFAAADPDAPAPHRTLLASGPFDRPARRVVTDGAALVGDAAGYYDPFTGQGIYQALAGAEILAQEADAALRRGDSSARALRRYARRRARLFRGARILQHLIEAVTARPRLADAAIRRLARTPAAADALVAATGDLRPVHSLLSPALALTFLIAHSRPETDP